MYNNLYNYLSKLQEQAKWLERANKTFAMTLYQLDNHNESHGFYAENLQRYASQVRDKDSYKVFIRYNKDVLLAIKGK